MGKETPTIKTIKLIPNSPWQPLYTQYTYMDSRYDSTKRQNQPPKFKQLQEEADQNAWASDIAQKLRMGDFDHGDAFARWHKYGYDDINRVLNRLDRLQAEPYDADAHIAKMLNESQETPKEKIISGPNINDLVKQTLQGKFGNGAARKAALGDNYAAVQALINKQLAGKRKPLKVDIPTIEQKYVTIEPGHEPPTEPLDIPQYYIDRHFETTNTPLTGAEIAAIRMDPFNLHAMSEEEVDKVLEESPEERKLARSERREQRKENRAQRKEARKQRRLSRRSKNNKTE